MDSKTFMASCPICGRSLFKGKPNSYIEGGCPKCNNYLQICYTSEGVKSIVTLTKEKENSILPKR
jgi:phage FluMu protein Com